MSRRGVARATLLALAAAHVADALVVRARARRLPELDGPPPAAPPDPAGAASVLVPAGGVAVPLDVRECAAALGVDLVDLVPGDLGAERMLSLLRRVDPAKATGSPGGAHHAVVLSPGLAARLGVRADPDPDTAAAGGTDVRALARLTRSAQHAADDSRGLVVAPGVAARPGTPEAAWEDLDAATEIGRPYASLAAAAVAAQVVGLAAIGLGALASPGAAAAALGAWWAKPALALGGERRPADLARATARRPLARAAHLAAVARAGLDADRGAADGRRAGLAWPAPDDTRFFAPRRTTCPWCEGHDLTPRLDTRDLLQHKAGRFRLDACGRCGHVFQNPQLAPAGLDYYYDQFYDGIGGELMTQLFATGAVDNRRRIAAVAATGHVPRRWLDVGTGHGHFPRAARERWPDATFDGIDLSGSVEDAARRGWVDRGLRGLFPEMVGELDGYDVVSLHHYLEHTRDPAEELDAVAKVLPPGGLVEIELPDPECVMGRVLGRYWLPWLQPQHLHFVPAGNLVTALQDRGFTVVSVQRDEHQAVDLLGALALALEDRLPSAEFPWRPAPSRARQVARGTMMTAALPAFAAAAAADHALGHVVPRLGPANAYRVIARRT